MVIQLIIIWTGLYESDFKEISEDPEKRWFWACLEIICLLTSMTNVLVTSVRFDHDPLTSPVTLLSVTCLLFTCLFRALVLSFSFKIAPLLTCLIMAVLFITAVSVLSVWGN